MITVSEMLDEVSELNEKIAHHRLNAQATFKCLEDEDVVVEFIHFDVKYKHDECKLYLFTFSTPHDRQAFHYQIDKLFEMGGLLDESI